MTAKPCLASIRFGCPDEPSVLVCHQPHPHPGLNHYDAGERIWWARTDATPVLCTATGTKRQSEG